MPAARRLSRRRFVDGYNDSQALPPARDGWPSVAKDDSSPTSEIRLQRARTMDGWSSVVKAKAAKFRKTMNHWNDSGESTPGCQDLLMILT
jgi:hypothetical protein